MKMRTKLSNPTEYNRNVNIIPDEKEHSFRGSPLRYGALATLDIHIMLVYVEKRLYQALKLSFFTVNRVSIRKIESSCGNF